LLIPVVKRTHVIQVLARRARLFQLKTALDPTGGAMRPDVLQFPPLTWLVEDFFQDQVR